MTKHAFYIYYFYKAFLLFLSVRANKVAKWKIGFMLEERPYSFAKVCQSKTLNNKTFKTNYVDQDELSGEDDVEEELGLYGVYTKSEVKKYQTIVHIDNEQIVMEIDTGAAVSIIPESLYSAKFVHFPLVKSKVKLF